MKKSILITLIVIILVAGGTLFYLYTYTDLIHAKLLPKAESITIKYAPAYDYEKALEKNKGETEFIKIQELKINDDNLQELKSLLKGVSKLDKKVKDYKTIAEIQINNDTRLIIGDKYGKIISKDNKTTNVKVPSSLSNKIKSIIEENNKKVLETPKYERGVIKKDGAVINLTNKTNIDIVKEALPYYRINQTDDYTTYDNGYKELFILNDNIDIYLYSSNIGYIKTDNESYYVIFPNDLEEIIKTIYEISIK